MSGECILIIDDSEEMVKHLTGDVLPSFGYKTLFAYDGQTGLALIHERQPDLVMLDYNLPEMTGIDVLQQMVQDEVNTPVVLMTGYGSELSAIKAFRLGAKDYLIKPFTVDEIIDTIDRALVETRLLHDKEELADQLRRMKVEMSRQTNEMKTLFRIGKAITSLLSVDKVLERVLDAATYLTNGEESMIWLSDKTGKQLQVYEKHGEKGNVVSHLPETDSLVAQVMETGRPLRLSLFSGQGIQIKADLFARALLYVPLKLRGMTLGVLGVSNLKALRSFSKRDEFLLSFLADYAAIALENARVFQAADQTLAVRLEELNTLIDITHTITSTLDLDEVVRLTIKQVHDSWRIEASSLWLLDEKRKSLSVLANVGTPADLLENLEVPLGMGIVGHVAKTGKWISTNDVASHPLHYRQVDDLTGFHTRALLCVPLMFRGKVVGALQLLNKQDGDFDDQDVERALSIAAAVAIAMTNALLFHESESRKQQLETTLERNNSPILITDANDNLHLLNQEARSRLHLSMDAVGKPVREVIKPARLAAMLTGSLPEFAEELLLGDGSIWLPRVAPIPGHGRILIMQDITELRKLSQEKDHFVATVSHDMRTPLNTISGFATSLADVGPLTEKQALFVERILNASNHMMGLVNDLLELARVNSQYQKVNQPCDLLEIVSDVVQAFQGQAMAKEVSLVLIVENEARQVMGDPVQLRRAVSNLVDNAIKYSSRLQQVQVKIVWRPDSAIISVRDQGHGISKEDMPHIFDKFYRGRNNEGVGGTGLGLALVRSIIEAHGGRAWAQSMNGKGAEFLVQLPAAIEESHQIKRDFMSERTTHENS